MVECLKCGRKRTEKGLDLLRPCPYCGVTFWEEVVIADTQLKEKERKNNGDPHTFIFNIQN